MVAGISKSLRLLAETLEKEPAIFIDSEGSHWFNNPAENAILKKGLQVEEFIEWLRVGSSNLRHLNCHGLGIHMLRISEEEVLVFLRSEQGRPAAETFNLTRKEKEVLGHVVRGFTNRKIATTMKISAGTVNSHLDKIYFKLGCSSRLAASFIALQHGLFLAIGKDRPKDKRRKRPL